MSTYSRLLESLKAEPRRWLVTGCAGFIGSHLTETLLAHGQTVSGLDDFSTGKRKNLDEIRSLLPADAWKKFRLVEGSICDLPACHEACRDVDFVLHQAALVSVPQSIEDPIRCNNINVAGFLNVLVAARDAKAKHLIYASSSAVYGDAPDLPSREDNPARPISPYGTSKLIDELYADVFTGNFGIPTIGLRYFNVFGPRQDPAGGYAAVIPKWIAALLGGEAGQINGDGSNTRDFCHVANVVQANILAALSPSNTSSVFNVGLGARTSLNELYEMIRAKVAGPNPKAGTLTAVHNPARPGDILHSQAKITKIRSSLGYEPAVSVEQGLEETVGWYARQ